MMKKSDFLHVDKILLKLKIDSNIEIYWRRVWSKMGVPTQRSHNSKIGSILYIFDI